MTAWVSLVSQLAGLYKRQARALPKALRDRVTQAFFPLVWDQLAPSQREQLAVQLDAAADPSQAQVRQHWWDHFVEIGDVKRQIATWENVATPTAQDLIRQQTELEELKERLARLEAQGGPRAPAKPKRQAVLAERGRYIAYPVALKLLDARLQATPEEVAAWIFMGPEAGGLRAYLNALDLEPPPRFQYAAMEAGLPGADADYLTPLQACWFAEDEVQCFLPGARYLTGKALVDRWTKVPGVKASAFIDAKVRESRLVDLHPVTGGTQAGRDAASRKGLPAMEEGLFAVAEVEAIELADFGAAIQTESPKESPEARRRRLTARVDQERKRGTRGFLAVVAAEEGLSISRLKQLTQAPKAKAPKAADWLGPVQSLDRAGSKRKK